VRKLHDKFDGHVIEEEHELYSHLEKAGEEEMVALAHKIEERRSEGPKDLTEHMTAHPTLTGEAG
jgi:hypothetical protein